MSRADRYKRKEKLGPFKNNMDFFKVENFCSSERPPRKVFCQLPKGHRGSHRAVIYWEEEQKTK